MQLYQTRTGVLPLLGGGSVNVDQHGFLGLSGVEDFFDVNGYGPFTRLHLADLDPSSAGQNFYNQPWGFRTWMRNGITLTGNHDHSYIGQKYNETDKTDLIIHWSDNPNKEYYGPDRLRFLFTSDNTGASSGANSEDGLEFMRMKAISADQGWIGVGNYAQPGISEPEPTERLDLLDNTIRLRDFADPTLYRDDTFDRILVADPSDGRVYWRPFSTFPSTGSGADCDWIVGNDGTSGPTVSHDVVTAVGVDDLCPDRSDLVGIGTVTPLAKLHVQSNTVTDDTPNDAVVVHMLVDNTIAANAMNVRIEPNSGVASEISAVNARADNADYRNFGVRGRSYLSDGIDNTDQAAGVVGESEVDGTSGTPRSYGVAGRSTVTSGGTVGNNYGLYGYAQGGAIAHGLRAETTGGTTTNYGVRASTSGTTGTDFYGGEFLGNSTSTSGTNYGVYASAWGGTTNWAGWFNGHLTITGNGFVNGTVAIVSDEQFKTNVEEIGNASEILSALDPKSYLFNESVPPGMHLPEGRQFGVLAQELEAVLPELVLQTTYPAQRDSAGAQVSEALNYKAVNYIGLIPILIAGHKEQQQTLDEQRAMIDQLLADVHALRTDLASCCASGLRSSDENSTGVNALDKALDPAKDRLLRIAPNPFNERTTVFYTVPKTGRAQLLVNSSDGKDLRVLHEGTMQPGDFQFEWNTTELAAGTYYVTLLLNGETVVQKVVKVSR